jgi:hypothetical protein
MQVGVPPGVGLSPLDTRGYNIGFNTPERA